MKSEPNEYVVYYLLGSFYFYFKYLRVILCVGGRSQSCLKDGKINIKSQAKCGKSKIK